MISRETVKKQIDLLSENQLSKIADYISSLKMQTRNGLRTAPFWQNATPKERAEDFREWVSGLNKTGQTLPDEAFDRGTVYES